MATLCSAWNRQVLLLFLCAGRVCALCCAIASSVHSAELYLEEFYNPDNPPLLRNGNGNATYILEDFNDQSLLRGITSKDFHRRKYLEVGRMAFYPDNAIGGTGFSYRNTLSTSDLSLHVVDGVDVGVRTSSGFPLTFDPDLLGFIPTQVGFVVTAVGKGDVFPGTLFDLCAVGANQRELGCSEFEVTPLQASNQFYVQVSDDQGIYGLDVHAFIYQRSEGFGDLAIDDLQLIGVVPEPTSASMLIFGMMLSFGMATFRRRVRLETGLQCVAAEVASFWAPRLLP